jgi:uridine phosphorylase
MNKARKTIENYYYGFPDQIAEKMLFIKRENRLDEYKASLTDVVQFGNVWNGITGILRGEWVSIIVTGIGPSQVCDAVYALDKPGALCLYSGTCGSLKSELRIGDYFLAEEAVCADGSSYLFGHAMLSCVSSEQHVFNSLKAAFDRLGIPLTAGLSFTTSSVVRENDIDFWRGRCPQPKARRRLFLGN